MSTNRFSEAMKKHCKVVNNMYYRKPFTRDETYVVEGTDNRGTRNTRFFPGDNDKVQFETTIDAVTNIRQSYNYQPAYIEYNEEGEVIQIQYWKDGKDVSAEVLEWLRMGIVIESEEFIFNWELL